MLTKGFQTKSVVNDSSNNAPPINNAADSAILILAVRIEIYCLKKTMGKLMPKPIAATKPAPAPIRVCTLGVFNRISPKIFAAALLE